MADEKQEVPQTNRAMRRNKGRMITKADIRKWRAESIKQKLFTPKKI